MESIKLKCGRSTKEGEKRGERKYQRTVGPITFFNIREEFHGKPDTTRCPLGNALSYHVALLII
jgi:hypothetical protein